MLGKERWVALIRSHRQDNFRLCLPLSLRSRSLLLSHAHSKIQLNVRRYALVPILLIILVQTAVDAIRKSATSRMSKLHQEMSNIQDLTTSVQEEWTNYIQKLSSPELKVKGLLTEEYVARNDLVLALPDRIEDIPDGTAATPKQTSGWSGSASCAEIKFDSGAVDSGESKTDTS